MSTYHHDARSCASHFARRTMLLSTTLLMALVASMQTVAGQSLLASAASHSDPTSASRTLLGDVRPFGQGTARTWVQTDAAGAPTTIGITLTEDALLGLPQDVTPGLIWMVEYVLALPDDVPMLPFDHVGVNWNPRGHIPDGIYNVPHLDFHFYTVDKEQRRKITARGADLEMCRMAPPAGHMPEGFMFAPESEEPGMGGHWVDPQAHEFHGKGFTHTFIYGTHGGKVIFYEPMITKAFLETRSDASYPLKMPDAVAETGYYPSSYGIRYDAKRKEHSITLEGLTLRHAAP